MSDSDFVRKCASLAELLEAAGCSTLAELEGFVEGHADCFVHLSDETDGLEVLVVAYNQGVVEPYPCSLNDVIRCGEDLLSDWLMQSAVTDAVEAIEDVEELIVELDVDEHISNTKTLKAVERRVSYASGALLQDVGVYPFDDPYPGDLTVGQWVLERVFPAFPGCRIMISAAPAETMDEARAAGSREPTYVYSSESFTRPDQRVATLP